MGYHKAMQKYIDSQMRNWQQSKEVIDTVDNNAKHLRPFVTISREYGSGAYELAEKLVMHLNEKYNTGKHEWAAYDRGLLDNIMNDMGFSQTLAETLTNNAKSKLSDIMQTFFSTFPPQVAVYRKLAETMRTLAYNGNVVLVGRAGNTITKDMSRGFHVRLVAPMGFKVKKIIAQGKAPAKDAEQFIRNQDDKRNGFIQEFLKIDNTDPQNYHLFINMGLMSADAAAKIIANAMKENGLL